MPSALQSFHRTLLAAAVRRYGANWIERLFPLYKPPPARGERGPVRPARPAVVVADEEAFEAVAEMLAEVVTEAARKEVVVACAPSAITLEQVLLRPLLVPAVPAFPPTS
jgi:hypothetical protein